MTISKKLLLLATLGLGLNIPCITSANYNVELHHEMTIISDYMPLLRQHVGVSTNKVVQWLERKLQKQSLNKYDATTIANIIRSNATVDNKVDNILQIITIKEAGKAHLAKRASNEQLKLKAKKIAETALICGLGIFCGALILIDAATNPYRYTYPDSVTTTQTYQYRNHAITVSDTQYHGYNYYSEPYYSVPTVNIRVRV